MTIVGSAYVDVHAVTSRVRSEIQSGFDKATPGIGAQAGKAIDQGISSEVGKTSGTTLRTRMKAAGAAAGNDAGGSFVQRMRSRVLGDRTIGQSLRKLLTGSADGGGRDFARRFIGSADNMFKKLPVGKLLMGSLTSFIGPAISAIGALGGGAVSLASSLAQAAGVMPAVYLGLGSIMTAAAGVKLAFSGVGPALHAAMNPGTSAATLQTALKNLTPAARTFVMQLKSMRPELQSIKQTAAKNLFPGLTEGLKSLHPLLGPFRSMIGQIDKGIGNAASSVAKLAAGPMKGEIQQIFSRNAKTVGNLTSALTPLAAGLIRIIHAAQPVTVQLSHLVDVFANWLNRATAAGQATGKLSGYFQQSFNTAKQLGDILLNVGRTVFHVFTAAQSAGGTLLDSIKNVTAGWAQFTGSTAGQNRLQAYFAGVVPSVKEIASIVGEIIKDIAKMGNSSSLQPLLVQIHDQLVPALNSLLQATSGPVAQSMVTFLTNIINAVSKLSGGAQTGFLNGFVRTLSLMAQVINDILSIPGVKQLAGILGGIAGSVAAVGFAMSKLKMLSFVKGLIGMGGAAKTVAGQVGTLEAAKKTEQVALAANDVAAGKSATAYGNVGTEVGGLTGKLKGLVSGGLLPFTSFIRSKLPSKLGGPAAASAAKSELTQGVEQAAGGGIAATIATRLKGLLGKVGIGAGAGGIASRIGGAMKGVSLTDILMAGGGDLLALPLASHFAQQDLHPTWTPKPGSTSTQFAAVARMLMGVSGGPFGGRVPLSRGTMGAYQGSGPSGLYRNTAFGSSSPANSVNSGRFVSAAFGTLRDVTTGQAAAKATDAQRLAAAKALVTLQQLAKTYSPLNSAIKAYVANNSDARSVEQQAQRIANQSVVSYNNVTNAIKRVAQGPLVTMSKQLTGSSHAAQVNRQTFAQAGKQIDTYRQRLIASGAPMSEVNSKTAQMAKHLENTATKTYGDKKAVDALMKSMHLLPDQVGTSAAAFDRLHNREQAITSATKDMHDAISRVASGPLVTMSKSLSGNSDAAKVNRQSLSDAAKQLVSYRQNLVSAGQPMDQVNSKTQAMAKQLQSTATSTYGNAKAVDSLLGKLRALPGQMQLSSAAFGKLRQAAIAAGAGLKGAGQNAGYNYVEGVIQGLQSKLGVVESTAALIAHAIDGTVRSAKGLSMGSPSKKGHKSGVDYIMGLIGGMKAAANALKKQAQANALQAVQGLEQGLRADWQNLIQSFNVGAIVAGIVSPHAAHHTLKRGEADVAKYRKRVNDEIHKEEKKGLIDRSRLLDLRKALDKRAKDATDFLADDTKRLESLASRRKRVAQSLAQARQHLQTLQQQASQLRQNITSGISQFADISQSVPSGVPITARNIVIGMRQRMQIVRRWAANIKELVKRGLNRAVIQSIIAMGPDAGYPYTDALIDATKKQIAEINQTQQATSGIAKHLAHGVSDSLYKSGIAAAKGLVKGLQSREGELRKAAKRLGEAIVKELKKELKIHSPSQRLAEEVGAQVPGGVAQGILSNIDQAERAARLMAGRVAKAGASRPAGLDLPAMHAAAYAGPPRGVMVGGQRFDSLLSVRTLKVSGTEDVKNLERMLFNAARNLSRAQGGQAVNPR